MVDKKCVYTSRFDQTTLIQLNQQVKQNEEVSKVGGASFGVMMSFGLSRFIGDFVIKTALLKLHIWYSEYFS
jgi:hypothetical protein